MTHIRPLPVTFDWRAAAKVKGLNRPPSAATLGAQLVRVRSALIRRPRFMRGERIERPILAPSVRTERLTLRPHRVSDAEAWYSLQSDPRVVQYLSWPLRDRTSSLQHLRDRTRHNTLWQRDDFLALAIERSGRLIGDVSLHLRSVPEEGRYAEIGWVVSPAESRKGHATEAAEAVLDIAFGRLHARWVIAEMDPRNRRSIELAGRLGFVLVSEDAETTRMMVTPDLSAESRIRRSQWAGHTGNRGSKIA